MLQSDWVIINFGVSLYEPRPHLPEYEISAKFCRLIHIIRM
jgi:hypothetical protein